MFSSGRMGGFGSLRDGEVEGGAFPEGGVDPDSTSITFNHALANGEPNAGAVVLVIAVKPLE
jgi:hypothetical protein